MCDYDGVATGDNLSTVMKAKPNLNLELYIRQSVLVRIRITYDNYYAV